MTTPEPHPRAPWLAMSVAALLLLVSLLAACRIAPSPRVSALPERHIPARTPGPDIRVRLLRETNAAAVGAPGALRIFADGDTSPRWTGDGPVAFTRTPEGFVLSPSGATLDAERVRVVADAGLITLSAGADTVRLEGEIDFVARTDASPAVFDVVEHIPLERYLPGVLAKELYHHFEIEAYEAQAIAARSYAMHEKARRAATGSHFDVEASTMDQAYAGAGAHGRAEAAVRSTAGRVLLWHGEPLRAYYSSTCGDRPASARDTWPTGPGFEFNTADPIQARPRPCACGASPRHRWSIQRPADDTADRLRAWGLAAGHPVRELASIRAIDVEARNDTGRPSRYRVSDDRGKPYSLSAEELRLAFNTDAKGRPEITAATRVLSGDLRCNREGDTLRLEGRGFGHGVGLCQFGADGLAKQGLDARGILARYYPGSVIERLH